MARMPDGYVFTVESDGEEWWLKEARELVMCKSCWKRGLDNCPMEFYWDCHPANDDCYCAMGERRNSE